MKKSTPPPVATWLLKHLASDLNRSRNDEAIAGDLMEHFQEGRSRLWYWCQVLIAIARPESWSVWVFARVLIVGWLILGMIVPPLYRQSFTANIGMVCLSMLAVGIATGGLLALLNRPNHLVPMLIFAASCLGKDMYRLILPGVQMAPVSVAASRMYIITWLIWTAMDMALATGVMVAAVLGAYRSHTLPAKPLTIR